MSGAEGPGSDPSAEQTAAKTRRVSRVIPAYEPRGGGDGPDQGGPQTRRISRITPAHDSGTNGGDIGMDDAKQRRKSRVDKPGKSGSDGKTSADTGDTAPPVNNVKGKKPEVYRPTEQVHYEFSYSKAVYDYVKSHRKGRKRSSRLPPLPPARPGYPQATLPVFAQGVVLHHVHKIDLFGIPDDTTFIFESAGPPHMGFSPRLHVFGDQPPAPGTNKKPQRKSQVKDIETGDAWVDRGRRPSVLTLGGADPKDRRGSVLISEGGVSLRGTSNDRDAVPEGRTPSNDREAGAGGRRSSKDREADGGRRSSKDREANLNGRRSSKERESDTEDRRTSKNRETDTESRRSSLHANNDVDTARRLSTSTDVFDSNRRASKDEGYRRASNELDTETWVTRSSKHTNDSPEVFYSDSRRPSFKNTPGPLSHDRDSKTFNFGSPDIGRSFPKVTFAGSDGRVSKRSKRRVSITCPLPNLSKSPLPPALTRRRHRRQRKKDVAFSLPALQCARLPAPRASLASLDSDKDDREGSSLYSRRKHSRVPKLPKISS